MIFLFGSHPTISVAQVIVDPNALNSNKPTVETTANGTTMIQITTPSAGGVSRNVFQQLDIEKSGLIFNNAYFISKTSLAGYVHGNPNLANGSARIILNEVTGTNPSYLRGYAEIAGQRADLIIANPNGIVGDGFGFINTGRAVLTTGIPVYGGSGSLDAFHVTSGQISIQGDGLNASDIDRVDLISRAVNINANIYAKELNVVTGANQVGYNTFDIQAGLGEGIQPQVQIDVGQLGGMYAQKIYMVGTEKGVGVNSQGVISSSGDLNISSEGQVILTNKTSAGKNISINANDHVINNALLYSTEDTTINSKGDIKNNSIIAAGRNMSLTAENLYSTDTLGAGINNDGTQGINGNLIITTNGSLSTRGQNIASGNLSIQAAVIDVSNSKTYSGGNATLIATQGDVNNTGGLIQVDKSLTISAQQGSLQNNQDTNNVQAQINAGQITLTAGNISNQKSLITQIGDGKTEIAAKNTIDNSGGQINTNGTDLTIDSNLLKNNLGQVQHAGNGILTIHAADTIDNSSGTVATNGQFNLNAYSVNNNQGTLSSVGQGIITAVDNIDNTQGSIVSANTLQINNQGVINNNQQGIIQAEKGLSVITKSLNNQSGQLLNLDNNNLSLTVNQDLNNNFGVIGSNGKLAISAQNINNQNGTVLASDDLSINIANSINNTDGHFSSSRTLDMNLNQSDLNNTRGKLDAGNDLTLKAVHINNGGGSIVSSEDMGLTVNELSGDGQTISGKDLTITTSGDFTNYANSKVKANQNLNINVSGKISNNGEIVAVSELKVSANDLANGTNATLTGGDKSEVLVVDTVDNRGRIEADTVRISGNNLQNYGTVIGDNVTLVADSIANKDTGVIAATSNVNLFAKTSLENKDNASIYSLHDITIAGSESKDDNNQFTDRTGTLLNQSATIEAGNDIQIYANEITNKKREFVTGQTEVSRTNYGSPGQLIGGETRSIWPGWTWIGSSLVSATFPAYVYYGTYLKGQIIYETNILKDSPEGKIISGKNMKLQVGMINNNLSSILAGGALDVSADASVNNLSIGRTRDTMKLFHEYMNESQYVNYQYWEDELAYYDAQNKPVYVTRLKSQNVLQSFYSDKDLPSSTSTEVISGAYTSRFGGGQSVNIDAGSINNTIVTPSGVPINSGTITTDSKVSNVGKQTLNGSNNIVLPNNGLYTVHTDPTYSYLIETDSRFANFGNFLSSDYLYSQLLLDNKNVGKRIGDGFYEQKLVSEQINQLTGRELLQGYSSQEEEFKGLMDNAANYAKEFNLEIGVALTPEQMLHLSTDMVWLVEQEVQGQKVLVPVVYLAQTRANDIKEDGSLIVADNIQLKATENIVNSGVIRSANGTLISANNILDSNGVIAGAQVDLSANKNISINGGSVSSTGDINLKAGENIDIGSTESYQRIAIPFTTTEKTTNVVSSLQAGNSINLTAGQDANLSGVQVNAGGDINISASDVNIAAVKDRLIVDHKSGVVNKNYSRTKTDDETVIGSNLNAGGQVSIIAADSGSGSVSIEGSTINSQTSDVTVKADKDVVIKDVTERHETEVQTHREKSGFLSKKVTDTYDHTVVNQSQSSTISGEEVNIISGNDTLIQGSNIVGTGDVNLVAEGNVSVVSGHDTIQEEHYKQEKKSGIFGGGGLGITIGSKSEKLTVKEKTLEEVGSVIGSLEGNINIQSKEQITSVGTDYKADNDINITGKTVTIDNSIDTYDNNTKYELKQSGISVSLGGAAATTLLDAANSIQRSGEVADERLQALYVYKANEDIKDLKDMKNIKDGISVNVSIGSSKSTSEQNVHTELVNESNMEAGKTVNITATGDDVNLTGTQITAKDINIQAAQDINLNAAQNRQQTDSKSSSSSWAVGVELGGGLFANANAGSGREDGTITTNSESVIKASDTVTLTSNNDTNINGSKVEGAQVSANIGGDLNITSLQDTDDYTSKNTSSGIGVSTSGVTGSFNQGKMDSTYASVTDQAGIYAGKEGFDINVGGNTDLKGAVIASEADAGKNKLSTDTLTYSDIKNKAEYEASSIGISYTSDKGVTPTPGIPASGDADSTTKSAISPGTIIVGGKEVNPENLSRDTDNSLNALGKIFDKKTIQEKQELATLFGEEAFKAIGDIAARKVNKAKEADEAADTCKKLAAEARKVGNDDLALALERNASALTQMSKDIRASWDEGGTMKILLHAVVGGIASDLGGGNSLAGAVGAGASEASRKMLQELSQEEHRIVSGIIGAAAAKIAGGDSNDVQTGAGTAIEGTKNNFEMPHPDELDGKSILKMILAGPEGNDLSDDAMISMLAKAAKDVAFKETVPGAISIIQGTSDIASKIADLPVINKFSGAKIVTVADLFIQFPGEIVKNASKNYDVVGYNIDMAVADAFKAKGIETVRDLTVDKACDILAEKYNLEPWEKWALKQTIKKVAEECGIKNQG